MTDAIIGIDPGKSTGFAVYDMRSSQLSLCDTLDFWGAVGKLDTLCLKSAENYRVVIELPKTKAVWHVGAKTQAAKNRTAVNVGSVIREAELIVDWLDLNGVDYETVPPRGKMDAAMFKRITGWQGRTSQHARDAGILAWSRK
jgi:hypothetical protein